MTTDLSTAGLLAFDPQHCANAGRAVIERIDATIRVMSIFIFSSPFLMFLF